MAIILHSSVPFHFGTGFPTPLPPGWVLKESPAEWARAIDPQGKEHLLTANAAYPLIEGSTSSIDTNNPVPIPP